MNFGEGQRQRGGMRMYLRYGISSEKARGGSALYLVIGLVAGHC